MNWNLISIYHQLYEMLTDHIICIKRHVYIYCINRWLQTEFGASHLCKSMTMLLFLFCNRSCLELGLVRGTIAQMHLLKYFAYIVRQLVSRPRVAYSCNKNLLFEPKGIRTYLQSSYSIKKITPEIFPVRTIDEF